MGIGKRYQKQSKKVGRNCIEAKAIHRRRVLPINDQGWRGKKVNRVYDKDQGDQLSLGEEKGSDQDIRICRGGWFVPRVKIIESWL